MYYSAKIKELRSIIENILTPEITNDYLLLDLPYYTNIGDTLIWEGTKEFLKKLPYKCLYATDMNFFIERTISAEVVILLQGGGNLGDKYREHTEFRKRIIRLYPRNKIIILPQSIYYENEKNLQMDIEFYSKYSNVLICTRERFSFEFCKNKFQYNKILLIPDMAFYIDITKYRIPSSQGRTLFLKRKDSELVLTEKYDSIPRDAEVHDWPTFSQENYQLRFVFYMFRFLKLVSLVCGIKLKNRLEDFKRDFFYRKKYVQIGVEFLSKYDIIYTTRLHVLILAILLNKKCFYFNNSTGKLNNFYNSWLSDLQDVTSIS